MCLQRAETLGIPTWLPTSQEQAADELEDKRQTIPKRKAASKAESDGTKSLRSAEVSKSQRSAEGSKYPNAMEEPVSPGRRSPIMSAAEAILVKMRSTTSLDSP